MKLAFIGDSECHRGEFGEYRKWFLADSYGYSLLFSPEILHYFGTLPVLTDQTADIGKYDFLIIPECKDSSFIERCFCASKTQKVMIVQLSERVLRERCGINSVKKIPSLKETWHLPDKKYIYPSGLDYQLLDPRNAKVLSTVGENPDCFLNEHTGVFTTDFFKAVAAHIHEPMLPRLLYSASMLLSTGILTLMGFKKIIAKDDLRRDFHTAGYAFQIMRELCADDEFVREFQKQIIAAADFYISLNFDRCRFQLKAAFEVLAKYRRKTIPKDIFLIDTIHAGGMLSDTGYFEFDWPARTATPRSTRS